MTDTEEKLPTTISCLHQDLLPGGSTYVAPKSTPRKKISVGADEDEEAAIAMAVAI